MALKMGPSPDLPLDIFYCIMDTLACLDDLNTLKTCSLTCKDIRPLCLRHMFAKVKFTGRMSTLPLDQVKDLIDRNPKLATYIKQLEVHIEPTELDNTNFPLVLNQLQNVKTLLMNGGLRRLLDNTRPIPKPLQTSFERLICAPSLVDLQLVCVDHFPVPVLLAASTSLKSLTVISANNPSGHVHPIVVVPNFAPVPQLRSFTIAVNGPLDVGRLLLTSKRPDGLPVVSLASLECLTINSIQPYSTVGIEMMGVFLGVSPRLRSLCLQVMDQKVDLQGVEFFKYLHPSSLKTLQHLRLEFELMDEGDPYYGAYNELTRLASAGCPLERLEIDVSLCWTDVEAFMYPEIWNKLDILTLSKFATLREVTVDVHICHVYSQEHSDAVVIGLSQALQVAFNALSEDPSIKFHFDVHGPWDFLYN